jgi:hypothetical protein
VPTRKHDLRVVAGGIFVRVAAIPLFRTEPGNLEVCGGSDPLTTVARSAHEFDSPCEDRMCGNNPALLNGRL